MSRNIPFFFGAAGAQPPSVLSSQQQQPPNGTSPSSPPQPTSSMAQHAAFQQNAQLSGLDLSALDGISPHQLATIARLIQSGALRPPPELPTPALNAAPSTGPIPASEPQAANDVEPIAQEQDVDVDRDEGEIEEVGADIAKEPRGFLHPPPTGPRNLNAKQRVPQQNQRKPSPRPPVPTPPADKSRALLPQQSPGPGVNESTIDPAQGDKEMQAKAFVLDMLKNGCSFNDILKATGRPQALARMFTQMRLEVPPEFSSTNQAQANEKPTTNAPVKRPAPVKPSAPAKPLDRSEYLARLQAAKNKKAEPTNLTTAATTNVADKTDVPPKPGVETIQASSPDVDVKKVTAIANDKNALLRQRLEALRAEHAAKQNTPPQPTLCFPQPSPPTDSVPTTTSAQPADSSLKNSGLGAGLETVAVRASQMSSFERPQHMPTTLHQDQGTFPTQTILSPPPPTSSRSLGGLPGLFMFGQSATSQVPPPSQQSLESPAAVQPRNTTIPSFQASRIPPSSQTLAGTPTASPGELNIPRKRPVASDFDYPATKPKRPFGRSRGTSPAEPVVIITSSDEEDDDADDEMDTDNAAPPKSKLATASFRDAAPLRDFPSRPAFHMQPSGQSTPGASTPGSVTYEQRLKDIEEMKRKIAEKEKRKNANGRTPVTQNLDATTNANRSDAPSPAVQTSCESTPKVAERQPTSETAAAPDGVMTTISATEAATSAANASSIRPMSARFHERERLRQRLVELQQDQFTYVNVAVDVTADEPEPIDDISTNNADTTVQVASSPVVQETQFPAMPPEPMNELDAEEGEISDDSLFNFYSPTDDQGVAADEPAPQNVRRVGSQTSTSSERSIDDHASTQDQSAFVDDSQPAPDLPESPMETQLPNSTQEDDEIIEPEAEPLVSSLPGPGAQPEAEDEDEDEDSDYLSQDSDSNDDDSQDLDRFRPAGHDPTTTTNAVQNDVSDGIDASADADDYEPSLPGPVEATSEIEDPANSTSSPAAKSEADTADPPIMDKAPDDELTPELRPSAEEHAEATIKTPAKPHFKPYESALRGFKDFRWHPDFLQTASQGYQSLTFNHKIDANKPLCPFEGAGGQCNDPTCQFQHFREMGLTDTELLKLLGTHSAPAHSPDDHKRWNEGLGTVIKQLRSANVGRDVNAIATAIAEYRKEFVGDPTKVLNLG